MLAIASGMQVVQLCGAKQSHCVGVRGRTHEKACKEVTIPRLKRARAPPCTTNILSTRNKLC